MPKLAKPLTDIQVKTAKPRDKTYTLADGGGMYLEIAPTGSKIWRMSYRQANGKTNRLTFGAYPTVGIIDARAKRAEARKILTEGNDPGQVKRENQQAQSIAASSTFEIVARQWLDKTGASRKASTGKSVLALLQNDLFPFIGNRPVSAIGPRDVLAVLRRMETRGAITTAHRAKLICGQVFRFAVAIGLAERDVTPDLKGALAALPKGNYAAIVEPKEVAKLLRAIDTYIGYPYTMAALKLAPLVFVRPGELRSAEWAEIDFDKAEWNIPASKMKMKRGHIVPLSRQAVAILRSLQELSGHGKYVFPSARTVTRCMSDATIIGALRNMGYTTDDMTGHGFRAMARTIMDEILEERVELIEHQMAHAVKDPNGNAYNRTKHLRQRRAMMQRWADYLDRLKDGTEFISEAMSEDFPEDMPLAQAA